MFPRASGNILSKNEFDTYVNTHLICIKYAKIYNTKKYALFTHNVCFPWLVFQNQNQINHVKRSLVFLIYISLVHFTRFSIKISINVVLKMLIVCN